MPVRNISRQQYFEELARTSEKYFLPYLESFSPVVLHTRVLEVGCGVGGNLAPLARCGCDVTGVDLAEENVAVARACFAATGLRGRFLGGDFLEAELPAQAYDVVICHDVIEHIGAKAAFLAKMRGLTRPGGILFLSFPAWQMPFGGHQQCCRSRLLSHWPFLHLLPRRAYAWTLCAFGEPESTVRELLEIKATRTPIELFERVAREVGLKVRDRRLYFINPHYETKFGLRPRRLWPLVGRIPYVRNFFTTSCFYVLAP